MPDSFYLRTALNISGLPCADGSLAIEDVTHVPSLGLLEMEVTFHSGCNTSGMIGFVWTS